MSDTGQRKEETETVESRTEDTLVRPTLFIGLGGTGAAILTALRRRILQRLWNGHRLESLDDFKVAAFLYFDTFAGQAKDQEARKSENDPDDPIAPLVALAKADCIQAGLDPAKYLKRDPIRNTAELDLYPTIKSWLPADELTSINLEEGAGQIRSMSRLLFFDRINDLHSQISSKVRQLQNNLGDTDKLKYLGLKTTSKVNIKVVGSAAGGTGSGAFIDTGYLARSLKDPAPEEVSLWMVLGGAFSGQGSRVLANTYAALAELEYAMKLHPGDAPFVDTWDGKLMPSSERPFNRLYLFDSSNTAKVGVDQQGRDWVFRMVADIMMQEMAEPDLVGARRADLSNQDVKYREPMYAPAVMRQYRGQGLDFARLYSGIGQSTVDTRARIEFQAQGAEAAAGMLRAYFRINGSQATAPKPSAIEDFLSERIHLGPARQFTVHKDLRAAPVLSDYPLVFSRLLAKDGASLLESVQNDVAADFLRIVESPMKEWPVRAQEVKKLRRSLIEQENAEKEKAGLILLTRNVDDSHRRLSSELLRADGPLRQGILGLIDSEIGGIAYAEQFVEALKARLTAHWIPLFRRDADTYGDLATKVMSQLYEQAAENLLKESKGGLMSGPSRQRMETILNQMKDTLTTWMQYRLRQIACTRAADLLVAIDKALGETAGASASGEPLFTGILRDIHDGLATVEDTIGDLDREAKLIRDPDTAYNPIHQVIGTASGAPALSADAETYRNLAARAFENYGGATNLFTELKDKRKRAEILSRIRRIASEESGPSGKPLLPAESDVPSLIDELEGLPRNRQEEIISRAVKQAMPWINISKGKIGSAWSEDMNSVFVCVKDRERFKLKFGNLVSRAVSAFVDATKEINYVESETQGRLLICTELSGVPLDAMVQLHDEWFRQYEHIREDGRQAPLHTHKEWEKFGRPTAPDTAGLETRLEDLRLFIQGVGFGLLRRRAGIRFANAPDKIGQYEINLSDGLTGNVWVPIGKELKIRNFGLKGDHRAAILKQVQDFTVDLTLPQKLAAVALFEHYTRSHYPPRLLGKEETPHAGLGHLAAEKLVSEFKLSFEETQEGRKRSNADPDYVKKCVKALLDKLDDWTTEIEGSTDDIDSNEANKDPKTDIQRRSRPKRVLNLDVFKDEAALFALLGDKPAKPAVMTLEPGRFYWYIGADGKPSSRFVDAAAINRLVGEGVITPQTKLCAKGTKEWRAAESWSEFAELFEGPPPFSDEEAPPPP